MSETTMPAAEAAVASSSDTEKQSYEFAFHVLPTVAEGEVDGVFTTLKKLITTHNGEIFDEEAPERFELAYEIVQHIEGKNRKFSSSYFGWVRFKAESSEINALTEEIESQTDILRYLLIKLTRVEEENPFRFHEALKDEKMVTTVEESKVVPDLSGTSEADTAAPAEEAEKKEEAGEVDEDALDEALEKAEETK